ncbi:malto-oligosyltrehalose trehalohydrolase [Stieleria sp. ICT_E10.1]|uniref:malto-oligosyltrehalose trehalohydrolase n=1 Tax=Stieleria sedimenti TaxID=2976331 RepID=UPI0021807D5C|nr:malto-oligosyltrehalose trehalohydrolase [Stieleria sedimenti]MCS7467275.1 malto-oligosyltrehalose trehalohydrolase [Stieleria sedimenti]
MIDLHNCLAIEVHQHLGARPLADGSTSFSVWAPLADRVSIDVVDGPQAIEMTKDSVGYHHATVAGVTSGSLYFYRVDGGPRRPDPASRFQPQGVHGPSVVVDPSFDWTDQDYRAPSRDELIIYELHVGTFTDAGTFVAAIDRIAELVELGITAIELMPVAASAGRWNWGYDGVALFAPMNAFGTPNDFRRFVDAAHAAGLAVFLDVVYNHLGPEGNYLSEFGPYLSSKHRTVWGDAPNFDDPVHGDAVRRFFAANAVYWLDEFHLDGLRVDAIHCMADDREPHVAAEISDEVAFWSQQSRRNVMLIAESNVYDPEMTVPRESGGIGFDAMWCDDFLHSTFSVLRPGEQLCHRPYLPKTDLDHALRHGYVYEGTLRNERRRSTPSSRVDTHALVYSIQNHDFIGNHPLGVRLHQLTSVDAQRAAAALMMLSPAIPMLFMGEEFACEHPFRFFVDFSDQGLRDAVVEGRRREYPQHDWDGGVLPTDPAAFTAAKIGPRGDGDAVTLQWYRRLIELRKRCRATGLLVDANLTVENDLAKSLYLLRYADGSETLTIAVRLSPLTEPDDSIDVDFDGELILDSREESGSGGLRCNHARVYWGERLAVSG